jgi:hypothetical protein
MRVLVACEESQAVCIEFRALGHEAWSCDLLDCSGGHPEWHMRGDALSAMQWEGWDLILCFPPCTHLASSGARHFAKKRKSGVQQEGIDFFMACINANAPRVAVENPIGIMSTTYRKPDQIIQPYHYGDPFQKSTCLWLKGLPKLKPTNVVDPGQFVEWITAKGEKKRQPKWYYDALKLSPAERAKARSKTFPGIAQAMAQQWGAVLDSIPA